MHIKKAPMFCISQKKSKSLLQQNDPRVKEKPGSLMANATLIQGKPPSFVDHLIRVRFMAPGGEWRFLTF